MKYGTRDHKPPAETGARANFRCPSCDRPTLAEADDEIADYACSVCGERVREVGA